eukprot:gene12777-17130_t
MQFNLFLLLACATFIAFTIGLNLGLHRILTVTIHTIPSPPKHNPENNPIIKETTEESKPENPSLVDNDMNVKSNEIWSIPKSDINPSNINNDINNKLESKVIKENHKIKHDLSTILGNKLANIATKTESLILTKYPSLVNDYVNKINSKSMTIPIVLLTCNRPELLKETMQSLLKVRGVQKDNILISQDGNMADITQIANKYDITLIQNLNGLRLRGGYVDDGAARIAKHYKYSLTSAFDKFPRSKSIIIIEDDLLFSPDFYEYFLSIQPILLHDKTTFAVSAWNDNGFKNKVNDNYSIKRTDYFPGLGWLLTRELYKSELENKWPNEHWDHWLRSIEIHKNREIIYPEVTRTFHNGIKGTFMNLETHNRYFRDIDYNQDTTVHWNDNNKDLSLSMSAGISHTVPHFMYGLQDVYEYRIHLLLDDCKHLSNVNELESLEDEIVCIWINENPEPSFNPPPFQSIASFFGIWHEHRRGSHNGVHDFYWAGNYIIIVNLFNSNNNRINNNINNGILKLLTYSDKKPPLIPILKPESFTMQLSLKIQRKRAKFERFVAKKLNQNCDEVCNEMNKKCDGDNLKLLNNCQDIESLFSCKSCTLSNGPDQPAFVDPQANQQFMPGTCLINSSPDISSCQGKHHSTLRLCACI